MKTITLQNKGLMNATLDTEIKRDYPDYRIESALEDGTIILSQKALSDEEIRERLKKIEDKLGL